jgi:flavin-binding protein dodecin
MTDVAKIIEIVGSSDKGWQDAAQAALDEAKKTIHGITVSNDILCSIAIVGYIPFTSNSSIGSFL